MGRGTLCAHVRSEPLRHFPRIPSFRGVLQSDRPAKSRPSAQACRSLPVAGAQQCDRTAVGRHIGRWYSALTVRRRKRGNGRSLFPRRVVSAVTVGIACNTPIPISRKCAAIPTVTEISCCDPPLIVVESCNAWKPRMLNALQH